jgi:presenilin-like A22 family membrane protease
MYVAGYSLAQLLITFLSFLILGFLLGFGRLAERIAGVALLAAMVGTPFVDHLHIGEFRYGVAILSCGLFVTLIVLALRTDRWWLIAAAGVQLLSIGLWAATLLGDLQIWGAVTVRIVIWVQLMLLALFGIWEARAAPYAQPSQSAGAKARPGAIS